MCLSARCCHAILHPWQSDAGVAAGCPVPDESLTECTLKEDAEGGKPVSCCSPALPAQTVPDGSMPEHEMQEQSTSIAADSQDPEHAQKAEAHQNVELPQHRVLEGSTQCTALEALQPPDELACPTSHRQSTPLNHSNISTESNKCTSKSSSGEHCSLI